MIRAYLGCPAVSAIK